MTTGLAVGFKSRGSESPWTPLNFKKWGLHSKTRGSWKLYQNTWSIWTHIISCITAEFGSSVISSCHFMCEINQNVTVLIWGKCQVIFRNIFWVDLWSFMYLCDVCGWHNFGKFAAYFLMLNRKRITNGCCSLNIHIKLRTWILIRCTVPYTHIILCSVHARVKRNWRWCHEFNLISTILISSRKTSTKRCFKIHENKRLNLNFEKPSL